MKEDSIEKRLKLTYLLDIYSNLLTPKQVDILNLYCNEDYSLSEIASMHEVSRQAAFDLIKRTQTLLYDYDDKLGLYDKYLANKEMLSQIAELIDSDKKEKALEKINELMEEL